MENERKKKYAKAIMDIASAEDNLEKITDELYSFSQALEKSRDLYVALSDSSLPFERRNQIVLDLLSKKASATTLGIIAMMISAGRIKDLVDIAESMSEQMAEEKSQEVAYVRSATELTDAQIKKLTEALSKATGKTLDVKLVVDETLLGGVVATIGDTVIDGSVKAKLQKLRERLETK